MLATITLTILIMENLLLALFLLIWLKRHCQKCQKVKCIERMLNKVCFKCQDKPKEKSKEQIAL